MAIQARIPPALCAVHNFIRFHDEDEILYMNSYLIYMIKIPETSMENWLPGQQYVQRKKEQK